MIRSSSVLGRIPEGNRPLMARVAASDLNIEQVCETTRLVAGDSWMCFALYLLRIHWFDAREMISRI